LVWALALLVVTPAFADAAPATNCNESNVGIICDTGGQLGACVEDMCTRQTPNGEMTYACYVCKAGEKPTKGSEKEDDGCSASGAPAPGWAALFAPLAGLGLAAARRRRSQR